MAGSVEVHLQFSQRVDLHAAHVDRCAGQHTVKTAWVERTALRFNAAAGKLDAVKLRSASQFDQCPCVESQCCGFDIAQRGCTG